MRPTPRRVEVAAKVGANAEFAQAFERARCGDVRGPVQRTPRSAASRASSTATKPRCGRTGPSTDTDKAAAEIQRAQAALLTQESLVLQADAAGMSAIAVARCNLRKSEQNLFADRARADQETRQPDRALQGPARGRPPCDGAVLPRGGERGPGRPVREGRRRALHHRARRRRPRRGALARRASTHRWCAGFAERTGARCRACALQFEGWPAMQFGAFPELAIGTFGGEVRQVDRGGQRRIGEVSRARGARRDARPAARPGPTRSSCGRATRPMGWVFLKRRASLGFEDSGGGSTASRRSSRRSAKDPDSPEAAEDQGEVGAGQAAGLSCVADRPGLDGRDGCPTSGVPPRPSLTWLALWLLLTATASPHRGAAARPPGPHRSTRPSAAEPAAPPSAARLCVSELTDETLPAPSPATNRSRPTTCRSPAGLPEDDRPRPSEELPQVPGRRAARPCLHADRRYPGAATGRTAITPLTLCEVLESVNAGYPLLAGRGTRTRQRRRPAARAQWAASTRTSVGTGNALAPGLPARTTARSSALSQLLPLGRRERCSAATARASATSPPTRPPAAHGRRRRIPWRARHAAGQEPRHRPGPGRGGPGGARRLRSRSP